MTREPVLRVSWYVWREWRCRTPRCNLLNSLMCSYCPSGSMQRGEPAISHLLLIYCGRGKLEWVHILTKKQLICVTTMLTKHFITWHGPSVVSHWGMSPYSSLYDWCPFNNNHLNYQCRFKTGENIRSQLSVVVHKNSSHLACAVFRNVPRYTIGQDTLQGFTLMEDLLTSASVTEFIALVGNTRDREGTSTFFHLKWA